MLSQLSRLKQSCRQPKAIWGKASLTCLNTAMLVHSLRHVTSNNDLWGCSLHRSGSSWIELPWLQWHFVHLYKNYRTKQPPLMLSSIYPCPVSNYAQINSDYFRKAWVSFLILLLLYMLSSNLQTSKTTQTFMLTCSYEIMCRQQKWEQNPRRCAVIPLPLPSCLRTEPARILSSSLLFNLCLPCMKHP